MKTRTIVLLTIIGMLFVVGLIITGVIVEATNFTDSLLKEKAISEKDLSSYDAKSVKFMNDYNKAFNKNITIDKVKIKKESKHDQITLTYVEIDGKDFTVVSAKD